MWDTPDLSSSQICAGSLISDKHVLTSANCVSGDRTYYVHLGDTILGNDKDVSFNKTVLVTNKYLHPGFDFPVNDIAILEMAEPVRLNQYGNIKPVCLPDQDAEFIGYTSTVTGWGESEQYTNIYNSWLNEVQVTVRECGAGAHSTQLCVSKEAQCRRDWGGPLVVSNPNVNNNGFTIAGIVATGCSPFGNNYFTKSSLFTNWIIGIIGDATTCPPPPPNTRTIIVSCGQHSAIDCSRCPYYGDTWVSEGWCNGDCSWINEQCVLSTTLVSCGQHYAIDCSQCPYAGDTWVSEGWCNGDCQWVDQECLPITTRSDLKDDTFSENDSPTTSPTTTVITTTSSAIIFETVLKSTTEETSKSKNIINSPNFPLQYPDYDYQVGLIKK